MSSDPLERQVLEQDRPQYEQSVQKARIERAKKEQADYEEAVKQYEKDQANAEAQYQKDLAEYNKRLAEIEKAETQKNFYETEKARLEAKKQQKLADAHRSVWGEGGSRNRSELKTKEAAIIKEYNSLIRQVSEKQRVEKGYQEFREAYPGQILPRNIAETFRSSPSFSLVKLYQQKIEGKAAKAEYQRIGSAQTAQNLAAKLSSEYHGNVSKTDVPSGLGTKRGDAVKPTPNVIVGKQAVKTRRPLINVKTHETIYGQKVEANPRAFVASLDRQNVTAAGKRLDVITGKEGTQTVYSFGNISNVKDESAIALLEFQQQLKTRTAPSATVYKGILEEKGLPLTPLSKKIIDTYSSKGIFRGYEEPVPAKGRKGIISKDGKKIFDMETGQGSVRIGHLLGYKYSKPQIVSELGKDVQGPPAPLWVVPDAFGNPRTDLSGNPILLKSEESAKNVAEKFADKPSEMIIPMIGGGEQKLTIKQKPLSSSGQRFEFLLSAIEKEQLRTAKYDDDVAKLYHVGLDFSKDVIAGGAYLENLAWQGEALIRGGKPKTREIQIPHTGFTTGLDPIITGKPQMIIPDLISYEKKYGKGSLLGSGASLLLPIPGSEIKLAQIPAKLRQAVPQSIKQPIGIFAEKIKYPVLKNKLENIRFNLETAKNLRTVKKYAISRQQEGLFGIEIKSPKLFIITRGIEEAGKPKVRGYAEKQVIGFTKKDDIIKPIYSKTPGKQIFPIAQKTETLAELSIIEFQKKKPTLVTDIFKPTKPVTPVTQRIVVSSLDPEFYRTAKTLGMKPITQGTFGLSEPSMKKTTEFFKLEKDSQLNLVAVGYTAPLKDVKGLSKVERLFRIKQMPFAYVGTKASVTRFYETIGMGLGKGKGFIERIKSKDFISVGSKDMDKALERAGLTSKREIKFDTPYDTSDYKISGIGTGKATALSELTKKNIKMSFGESLAKKTSDEELKITGGMSPFEKKEYYKKIASQRRRTLDANFPNITQPLEVQKPKTDYLTQQSQFKPKYEYQKGGEIYFESVKFPEMQKIEINLDSLVSTRQQTKTMIRQETKEVQKLQPLQMQKPKLDTALVSRQKIRERTKQKLVTRMATRLVEASILTIKPVQKEALKQPQLQKVKQVQKLKFETPKVKKTTERIRRPRRGAVLWKKEPFDKSGKKKGKGEKLDYIGNVPESQVEGMFGRKEITYGKEKVLKLKRGDVRVLTGGKRTVRKSSKWYEGKKGDMFGFKEAEKKRKKAKSFW